jgi:hypothetical protein
VVRIREGGKKREEAALRISFATGEQLSQPKLSS